MTGVSVTFAVDDAELDSGASQAESRIRAATERMTSYMEGMGTAAAGHVGRLQSAMDTADGALQKVSTATALLAGGLEAMHVPVAAERMSTLAGRVEAVHSVLNVASGAVDRVAAGLDWFNARAAQAANSNSELRDDLEGVAEAQQHVAEETDRAETSWAAWIAGAVGVAAVVGAIYLAAKAFDAVTDAAGAAASAVADTAGVTDLMQRMSAESLVAAEALSDLSRELGIARADLGQLGNVAADFAVGPTEAETAMRRLVQVIEENSDKTREARDVLRAYGIEVRNLSSADWADVLDRFAEGLDNVRDGADKTRDVIAVLGNDGVKWLRGLAEADGDITHATTEANRVYATLAERIAASNQRIAEHQSWWDGVKERFDAMTSRSDEFRAKQEYALSHLAIAWREYRADVSSLGDVWDGLTRSAEDYFAVVMHGAKALQVPAPTADARSASPAATAAEIDEVETREPVADKTFEAGREALEKLKLEKENWLSWSKDREVKYWQDFQADMLSEWSESMTKEEVMRTEAWKRSNAEIARLGRDQAQEEARGDSTAGDRKPSVFEGWKIELDRIKAEEGQFHSFSRQEEIAFWEGKKTSAQAGARELQQIEAKILDLRKASSQDEYEQQQAQLKANQAAHRGDADYQLQIQKEIERNTAAHYGAQSVQGQRAHLETEAAERAHQEQMKALAQIGLDARVQAARDDMEAVRQRLAFERQMGEISAVEEVQRTAQAEQRRYAVELSAAQQKRALITSDVQARRQADMQIEQLERQHILRMQQLAQQEAVARRAAIRDWLQPIQTATQGMLQGLLQGTQTVQQVVGNVLTNVVASYAAKSLEMCTNWMADRLAEAIFGEAMATEEAATKEAVAAESAIAVKAQALGEISAAAAAGAAWAMASVAAIPFVGWAMAPGVGATHYALAMSYAASLAVPSAAGGWIVDRDTIAQVHEDERILPARYSAGLDALVEGAASGGSASTAQPAEANGGSPVVIHYSPTIHAMDGASVQRVLNTHRDVLVKIVQGAQRDFMGKTKR